MITPYVHRSVPMSADERAAAAQSAAENRDRYRDNRTAQAPARRAVILTGPVLRDVDAAVDCSCGCHPRPADSSLHDSGATCPCQFTEAEREAAHDELFSYSAELEAADDEWQRTRALEEARVAARADELGATVRYCGGVAPFEIYGTVEGRAFYLRKRHEHFRVEIAPDGAPSTDVDALAVNMPRIVVATGPKDALLQDGRFDEVTALDVAVDAVRLFLLRRSCAHPGSGRFCATCGIDRADAQRWRLTTANEEAAAATEELPTPRRLPPDLV